MRGADDTIQCSSSARRFSSTSKSVIRAVNVRIGEERRGRGGRKGEIWKMRDQKGEQIGEMAHRQHT